MALSTKLRFWIKAAMASMYYGDQLADAIDAKLESSALGAGVLATALTGFVSGAGAVAASDTLLQAINKLDGNVGTKIATSAVPAAVRATPITGFASGAGVVAAADTVLQAINKLDGNIAAKQATLTMGQLTTGTGGTVGQLALPGMTATGKLVVTLAEDPGANLALCDVVAGVDIATVYTRNTNTDARAALDAKKVNYVVISLT